MTREPNRTVAKLFGALLMAVGFMIALLAGLCCAVLMSSMIGNMRKSDFELMLGFGGVPILVGVGLGFGGYLLFRGPKKSPPRDGQ